MSKLPAIQFYPGDWRKDVGVQSLTFHDRGVWFEMLLLMHESQPRGVLALNGRAMPEDALARLLGLDKQILTTTITTLLAHGVASRDETTGALLSRRMVRDEKLRAVRQECGKLGGNPQLKAKKSRDLDKQKATTELNQKPTPSSSTSTSTSEEEKNSSPVPARREPSDDEVALIYRAYPRRVKPKDAARAIRKAVDHLRSGKDIPAMTTAEALKFLKQRVDAYAASPAGQQGNFTPYPASWFNAASYLEDENEWNVQREEQAHGNRSNRESGSERQQRIVSSTDRAIERARAQSMGSPAYRDYGIAEARA